MLCATTSCGMTAWRVDTYLTESDPQPGQDCRLENLWEYPCREYHSPP